jgi:L-fuculose-phosphate aldolase
MSLANARQSLLATAQKLDALHLNHGATGNISLRDRDGFWITPTGIPTSELRPEDMVWLGFDGTRRGQWQPSSEWMLHRDILRSFPEHNAVIHAHALNATTVACLGRDLPPFHYMIALAGGDSVRCAPYKTFGTQELADVAVDAMKDRRACLLAHHGLLAAADSLETALNVAVEVENLCDIYLKLLALGEPPLLNAEQMAEALDKFRTYGQRSSADYLA